MADPLGQHDRRLAEATTVERSLATRISAEVGPGDVDLRVTGTHVARDELLVEEVRSAGVLGADDERRRTSADVRVGRAFERRRRRRSEEAAGVGVDVEYHTAVPGASVTVEGHRRVARGIVCVAERREVLEEWRLPIAPRDPAIEGIVEAAVVEADAAVVLAGDDVRPVGRVQRDLLLGLPAQGAVAVGAWIGRTPAIGAAKGRCGGVRRRIGADRRLDVGGLRPLQRVGVAEQVDQNGDVFGAPGAWTDEVAGVLENLCPEVRHFQAGPEATEGHIPQRSPEVDGKSPIISPRGYGGVGQGSDDHLLAGQQGADVLTEFCYGASIGTAEVGTDSGHGPPRRYPGRALVPQGADAGRGGMGVPEPEGDPPRLGPVQKGLQFARMRAVAELVPDLPGGVCALEVGHLRVEDDLSVLVHLLHA